MGLNDVAKSKESKQHLQPIFGAILWDAESSKESRLPMKHGGMTSGTNTGFTYHATWNRVSLGRTHLQSKVCARITQAEASASHSEALGIECCSLELLACFEPQHSQSQVNRSLGGSLPVLYGNHLLLCNKPNRSFSKASCNPFIQT